MEVHIDDVAVDLNEGQLTFRLKISKLSNQSLKALETSLPTGQEQTVIFRNYQQISWLHDRIAEKYHSILLPPMPEKPSRNGDSVYVEKKRLQMERFLSKLFGREEIMDNSDLQYFLSDQMNTPDSGKGGIGKSLSRLLPLKALLPSDLQQGFRIFSPSDFVEGADEQEEFNKRRAYVLLMEKNLDDLLDRTVKLVKEQEQSAKLFYQFGYAQRELCQSFKGDSPHNAKAQSNSENFYQLCAELKEISQRQVRQEIYHFSDVVLEYKQSMACLKKLMNTRTDILIAYVAELRQKAGKFERMQKLRLQLPAKESEYQLAVKEEQEAGESVERAKKEFDQIKLSLTREMVRFERERQKDICAALCNYGQTQVQAGRDRTLAIRRLLEKFTTS